MPPWGCGRHDPLESDARGDSGTHRAVNESTSQVNKGYSGNRLKPYLHLSRVVHSSSSHRRFGLQFAGRPDAFGAERTSQQGQVATWDFWLKKAGGYVFLKLPQHHREGLKEKQKTVRV